MVRWCRFDMWDEMWDFSQDSSSAQIRQCPDNFRESLPLSVIAGLYLARSLVSTSLKLPRVIECVLDRRSVTGGEVGNNHHVLHVSTRNTEGLCVTLQ